MYRYTFEILRQRLASFLESLPETATNITTTDSPRGAQFLKVSAEMDTRVFWRWFPVSRARLIGSADNNVIFNR